MKSKKRFQFGLLATSLFIVGFAAYFAGLLTSARTPTTEAQISPEDYGAQTRKAYETAVSTAEAEREKPVVRGVLGDFEIVGDYEPSDPSIYCGEGNRPSRDANFAASELNQSKMTLQKVCADGRVVATWSDSARHSYFLGRPVLQLDAPRENLELLDIDHSPALIARPLAGIGSYEIFVIQRDPSGATPGILIWTWGSTRSKAIAAAEGELEK